MKKGLLTLLCTSAILTSKAQTVSTFDQLLKTENSVINGSNNRLGSAITDGNAIFPNYYDTAFGGYWRDGFAVTNIVDSTTGDFTNLYGVKAGTGQEQSAGWIVGRQNAVVQLMSAAQGQGIDGFYVTNTTYAHDVIIDGNDFSKAFGGETGNDPDFFSLTIQGYLNGSLKTDTVGFFLADYRFEDNNQDYVVNDWQWVDLSDLGAVDSIQFTLTTTDVGQFGANTPLYYAIDGFTSAAAPASIANFEFNKTQVFPNPATNYVSIKGGEISRIISLNGTEVKAVEQLTNRVFVGDLAPGVYFLESQNQRYRFIKN